MTREGGGVAPYLDPERDLEARLKDLLGRMTLDEKLAQLGSVWASDLVGDEGFDEARAGELLTNGIGHVSRIGATSGLTPSASAAFANSVQRLLVERTRLGIPAIVHEEALAGYCARGATRYPQAIGLGATWSPDGIRSMARAIAAEMRAVGARQALAPVLDVARDPRWGRLEETFGEDPYLAGRLGVAYVRGLQAGEPTERVHATGRHFLGLGLPDGGMNHAPVQLGPRELREVYAEPFCAAIREAGLASVMAGYSAVDGMAPAGAPEMLEDLLRRDLGFDGTVLADDFAVAELVDHHGVARDKGDAAMQAVKAGVDLELPVLDCLGEPLKAMLESGRADPAMVDRAVRRVLRSKLELGLFERPYVDQAAAQAAFDTFESRALAGRLAEQSMVLLANDGTLPLRSGCRIALMGPAADDVRLLLGDHHYPVHAEPIYRHGETTAELSPGPMGRARAAAFRPDAFYGSIVSPRQALEEHCVVDHQPGCEVADGDDAGIAAAVAAAREADVAVLCLGGRSGLMPDCTSGKYRDATDLRLPQIQRRLVGEVTATGTPVVLVVIGGRAFALEAEVAACNAALMAWLPGQEGGSALARVLLGQVSPGGRLPVSLPRSVGQVPVHYNHRAGGGRSMVLGDYTDASPRPLFPFGHGLSYTSFDYETFSCPDTADVHASINLWVTVRNTGDRAADEVVQVYLRDKVADVARPVRQLAGFHRLSLPAGGARRLKFLLDTTQLGYYDRQMRFVVDPGEVEVMVGSSSRAIHLRKTLVLQGEQRVIQQQQVVATQVDEMEVEEEPPR